MRPRALAMLAPAAAILLAAIGHRGVAAAPIASRPLTGNPQAGKRLYESCMGCHSLDENDIGPKHRGVVGRRAGSVPGYAYSAVLRSSGIVWTPENLNRWLTDPQKMVPGAKMFFRVGKAQDRADIIAYLRQQN